MWIIKANQPQESSEKNSQNLSAERFSEYKEDDLSDKKLLTFPQRRADALTTIAESFLAKTADIPVVG
jgi:hypothetical protein